METINQTFKHNLIKSDLETEREGMGRFLQENDWNSIEFSSHNRQLPVIAKNRMAIQAIQ